MKRGREFICTIVICAVFVLLKQDSVFSRESSNLQNWIIYEYNETNGLPTGEANTVLQTQDGYVWVGSYGGLIRYDGTNFRNYSKEGAILSSSIRALFEDSKGRLWIVTNDRGVYLYENNRFTHYEYENAQKCLSVHCFTEDSKGNIYVNGMKYKIGIIADNVKTRNDERDI